MTKKIFIVVLTMLSFSSIISAQKKWTLQECVEYAAKNNLQLQQSGLAIKQADLGILQSRSQGLPLVNGSSSVALNLGRSIDPTSNSFENRTIFSNNFQVQASQLLYAGGSVKASIAQSLLDQTAAQADAAQNFNNIALAVAQGYLQVLLAEENLKITTERQAQTTQQLERLLKLIKAGTMPTGARLDLDAQLARDEQAIVQAQNTIDLAILNLKTLLNVPPQEAMLIEQPAVLLPLDKVEEWNAQTLYEQAIGNQPNLKAAELRRESAELGIEIAEARLKPRVSAFAQMNTNYSSLGKRVEGFTPATQYLGTVDVAGQLFPLNINTQQPILDNNPYFNQIGQNFSQAVGVSVTVPIYNAGQNKIAIERAKLGVMNADLQTQQLRRQLFTDIQRSLADAIAALKQFQAAERTQTAVELALRNTEKRVQAGAGNAFEYTIARSNADTAALNLLVAKYDYLFKLKVLDFYRGIPLQN